MDREQIVKKVRKILFRLWSGARVLEAEDLIANYILKRELEARIDEAKKYTWSFVSQQRIEDLNQQLKEIEK